jgi:hypothetical protein
MNDDRPYGDLSVLGRAARLPEGFSHKIGVAVKIDQWFHLG